MIDEFIPEMRFEYSFNALMKHEGGYSDNPNDYGGCTKYGITQHDLEECREKLNFPDKVIDLTIDDAKIYYKLIWWDPNHFEAINSLHVAAKLFDMCVNLGIKEAIALLQYACNSNGYDLTVDGILGCHTLSCVNEICLHGKEEDLIDDLCREQKSYYQHIIENHSPMKEFENGWMARAAYRGV